MPVTPDQHRQHIDAARRRVAHLAALADTTTEAERRIRDAAAKRLDAVEADIRKIAPRALLHDAAAERHAALVKERGRLAAVIARAEAELAGP